MTTKVTFELPADNVSNASEAFLLGDFNNWNQADAIQLQKKEDGSMFAVVALAAGRSYQYRYLLNDGRWVNDNTNTTWTEVYGDYVENCVVEVPATIAPGIAETKALKAPVAKKAASPKKATAEKATAEKATAEKALADDLSKLEGVGKKIALLLNKEGIISYKDLAKTTIKGLQAILTAGGNQYSIHNPASWPKQAKLAAAGKWEELTKLQGELKAGK